MEYFEHEGPIVPVDQTKVPGRKTPVCVGGQAGNIQVTIGS